MIEESTFNEYVDSRFYKNLYEEAKDKIVRERARNEDRQHKLIKALSISISINAIFGSALFCVIYLFLI